MAEIVYSLCFLMSVVCAVLLVRSWRRSRTRLLMWSSLCFVGLALNNLLLVLDLVLVRDVDLTLVRQGSALAALLVFVIGLIEEVHG